MSFSAEMKDFLGAYQSVTKTNNTNADTDYKQSQQDALTKKTARENDPDQLAFEDEKQRAQLKLIQAQIASSGVSNQYKQELMNNLRAARAGGGAGGGGLGYPTGAAVPTPGATTTTPIGGTNPQTGDVNTGDADTMDTTGIYVSGGMVPDGTEDDDPRGPPIRITRQGAIPAPAPRRRGILDVLTAPQYQTDKDGKPVYDANGKIVPAYAGGGAVPDAGDEDEDDAPAPTATPQPAVGGPQPDTDFSSRNRTGGLPPSLQKDGQQAIIAGYKHLNSIIGPTGALKTAAQKRAAQALAAGAGGLSPAEMNAARKSVDPTGTKYTDGERNIAALGTVYRYFENKDEPEKAQIVAGQMLQHFNSATTRYAAIAAHAAQTGDMDLAAKAAVKAYTNVPDGNNFALERNPDNPGQFIYYYTDKDGNDIAKGIATPEQLASSAMGLASGGFHRALLNAAGQAPDAGTPAKLPKPADRAKIAEAIDGPDSPLGQDRAADQTNGVQNRPDYWNDLRDATYHIASQNDATPHEAYRAAKQLIDVDADAKNPQQPFKVTDVAEDGTHTVQLKGGLTAKLPEDAFNELMDRRAATLKAMDDKQDADQDAGDKPGFWDRLKNLGGAVGSAMAPAVNPQAPVPQPGVPAQAAPQPAEPGPVPVAPAAPSGPLPPAPYDDFAPRPAVGG